MRPLVAAGDLYGVVVMLCSDSHPCRDEDISVAEGLIDLAATAFGTTAHVAKLERQQGELRRQQEMLARNEKLRALGQMAAGISHDLRNILNPLSLHLQVMTRALARAQIEDAQESVVEMRSVLQRGLESLERLRNFSRQSRETKTEPIDVNQLAREATAIGKSRAPSTSSFRVVDELGTPPPVMAISGEIVSALVNLVVNAVDAMTTAGTKSGTITLRSGETEEAVWVEIADNGPGMTPEIAKHVFDPFFTTKGEEGTGLGLAMVYSTMQRHGGLVTVDTKENQGSCFRLHFPKGGPGSQPLPSLHPSFLEPTSPRSPSSSEPDSDVSSDQPTPRRHDVQSRITRRR